MKSKADFINNICLGSTRDILESHLPLSLDVIREKVCKPCGREPGLYCPCPNAKHALDLLQVGALEWHAGLN